MEQLKLSVQQLQVMGFTVRFCPEVRTEDSHSSEKTVYEIECLNGVFGYDPTTDERYRWYQCVTIGDACNHICLNITGLPQLFTVLGMFKVNYNQIKDDENYLDRLENALRSIGDIHWGPDGDCGASAIVDSALD